MQLRVIVPMIKTLKEVKSTEICTGCFADISIGQSTATKYTFGSSLCVKCCSNFTKFDSVISKNKSSKGFNFDFIKEGLQN